MDATAWATFWAFAALVIFLGILVYMKVPGMIAASLDKRSEQIGNELDQAKTLRDDAQQLLAEYQRKRQEAESEAASILSSAEKEATQLRKEARQKSEDYITRRTAVAEQKIKQAETDAINEVRASAVDLALAAAERLIADKLDAKTADELFKSSVAEVKGRLN